MTGANLYVLQFRRVGSSTWTTRTLSGVTSATNITNLIPGITYEWQVKNVCNQSNPLIESGWAVGTNFTTDPTCNTPTSLSAVPSMNSATLSWESVQGANLYVVQWRNVGSSTWTWFKTVAPTATSTVISNLICPQSYEWQIKTVCNQTNPLVESTWASGGTFSTTGCGRIASREDVTLNWTLYPNPSEDGKITLSINGLEQATDVHIFSVLGNEIYTNQVSNGLHEIDLSRYAKGVYFAKINVNGNQLVKKLVIE
jgi:hypothetical protein